LAYLKYPKLSSERSW